MRILSARHAIAGFAFALLSMVSATADTFDDIKKDGRVRIAIDVAIPPFGMTDDKMQPTGSDVETGSSPKISVSIWRSSPRPAQHASPCCRRTRSNS
jgi:hypothetical protein